MQELTVNDWVTVITLVISLTSLSVSVAVFLDSKMKERTRKKEMMIDALALCHTLLDEAIRMHPNLAHRVGFGMQPEFADEFNKRADTLVRLSWVCKDLGEDIRKGASVLKSMVRFKHVGTDRNISNKERSEMLEKIIDLKDKIAVYLNEESTN